MALRETRFGHCVKAVAPLGQLCCFGKQKTRFCAFGGRNGGERASDCSEYLLEGALLSPYYGNISCGRKPALPQYMADIFAFYIII
jgi:hypothetical protein